MVFWGIEVKSAGVKFSPPFNLHITAACLGATCKSEERNVLQIKDEEGQTFPLCSLKLNGNEHSQLDIILSEGMEYFFSVSGKNSIFLTGYFVDSMLGDDESDSEGESMEEDNENGLVEDDDEDSEDDDEEFFDEELSEADEKALQAIINGATKTKKGTEELLKTIQKPKEQLKQVKEQPKEQPKQDNKRKAEAQITKEQQTKTAKTEEVKPVAKQTPTKQTPTKQEATKQQSPNKTSDLVGKPVKTKSGLQYQDIKIGNGPLVVAGKNVVVHYTGKLVSNGKIFDSSLRSGSPFTFRLGTGQVIAGWDQGVAGMKVGGKRILLIPSNLGYGSRGAGKDIPPNADLHFEVEVVRC